MASAGKQLFSLLALAWLAAGSGEAEGSCSGGDDASLLQASRSQADLAVEEAEAADSGAGDVASSYAGAFMAQEVSSVFYRPHFNCGSPYAGDGRAGNATHARVWLEEIMTGTQDGNGEDLTPPDFLGLSEMEAQEGIPGTPSGYKNYKVIGAVCRGYESNTKYIDPIALYYDSKSWNLLGSYPPNKKLCGESPPAQYNAKTEAGPQWDCPRGIVTPGDDTCCACTQGESTEGTGFYGNAINGSYFNFQGTRPFVAGKFKSHKTGREVCVVTFNLPHQLLAECSSSPTAACFGNAASSAYRIGTEQIVKATNELCAGTPLIFMGDTNVASGTYDTSFMFYNPFNKEVAKNAFACPQPSPLMSLRDPPSDLKISGQPYTCCQEAKGWAAGVNRYSSDRVAASGPSWVSPGAYFVGRTLRGGARKAGEAVAAPLSVGTGSSCPDVNDMLAGYPCCGSATEHAPVWGVFDLFR